MVRRVAANILLAYAAVVAVTLGTGMASLLAGRGGASESPLSLVLGTAWITAALVGWLLPVVAFGAVLLDFALRVVPHPRLVVVSACAVPATFSVVAGDGVWSLGVWCLLVGGCFALVMRLPPAAAERAPLTPVEDELPPLRL